MISAQQIGGLAASLGTPEGLARVNATIDSLNHQLMDPERIFPRGELADLLRALSSLSLAILSMNRVTRGLLGQVGAGAVNCVG